MISELTKPRPFIPVLDWFSSQVAAEIYLTTVSQAELLLGVELLPASRRRTELHNEIERMFAEDFEFRILPFDQEAARTFASISAERRRKGKTASVLDLQIAGIALSSGAAVATRNVRDFEDCGIKLINPWEYTR